MTEPNRKKVQKNFRLDPDIDDALSAASSKDLPKTAIVDHALRVELGLLKVEPSAPESLKDTIERICQMHPELDSMGIYTRIGRALGLVAERDGEAQPATTDPSVQGHVGAVPPEASAVAPSFESIVAQVEAAPAETRKALLERLLGEQLQEGAKPTMVFDHIAGEVRTVPPSQSAAPSSPPQDVSPGNGGEPAVSTEVQALAQQLANENGLSMKTALRLAAREIASKPS